VLCVPSSVPGLQSTETSERVLPASKPPGTEVLPGVELCRWNLDEIPALYRNTLVRVVTACKEAH
jgi:hypothetical protein